MKHVFWRLTLLTMLCTFGHGCGRGSPSGERISWEDCLRELADYNHLPVLDGRNIRMYASYDRTGGNNDFNNFAGKGSEPGWVTLVDLKGPGCIRRFWMTGTDPGHPVRIYIDGEKQPRIDSAIDTLFGEKQPWVPPLAQYVNMCYYSYIPITYQRSIRIETREPNVHPFWGPRRIFFQIAAETFPSGTEVESYPRVLTPEQLTAAGEVGKAWTEAIESHEVILPPEAVSAVIDPGQRADVFSKSGVGTVTAWNLLVEPANAEAWTRLDQEFLLQDTVLRVYYDGQTAPSIEAPLGDFFANGWRKRAYGSWWFTSGEGGFSSRLPMPFADSIRIEVENAADRAITVRFHSEHVDERLPGAGYLHGEFRRSGPGGGQPHLITRVNGRGKFLGCFLGITGTDQSWWILEGDERMWVDGNPNPVWLGTGLEDYFNGGWYYRGSVFGALNASFDRAPFRVAQFRHQHPDPVSFNSFFQMDFERMNDEHTGLPVNGWFQSVAYFYLERPTGVTPVGSDRAARRAVEHPHNRPTTLLQLIELERANDFHGAMRLVEEYQERYPDAEENGVWQLRHLEYRRLGGESIGNAHYQPYRDGHHGETAREQARLLEWFYEEPNRAIVGLNVNGRGRLWLNNQLVLSGDHPYNLFAAGLELTNGLQQLAAQVEMVRGEPWVQAGVRTHEGLAGTGPGTWCSRTVDGGWRTAPAGPPNWQAIGLRDVPRGVPDAPYIGGIPNAFILVQSKSYPVRGLDWGYYQGTYYYRQDFDFPLIGWPAFSRIMTGLLR